MKYLFLAITIFVAQGFALTGYVAEIDYRGGKFTKYPNQQGHIQISMKDESGDLITDVYPCIREDDPTRNELLSILLTAKTTNLKLKISASGGSTTYPNITRIRIVE